MLGNSFRYVTDQASTIFALILWKIEDAIRTEGKKWKQEEK